MRTTTTASSIRHVEIQHAAMRSTMTVTKAGPLGLGRNLESGNGQGSKGGQATKTLGLNGGWRYSAGERGGGGWWRWTNYHVKRYVM